MENAPLDRGVRLHFVGHGPGFREKLPGGPVVPPSPVVWIWQEQAGPVRGEGVSPLFFRVEGASSPESRAGCPRHARALAPSPQRAAKRPEGEETKGVFLLLHRVCTAHHPSGEPHWRQWCAVHTLRRPSWKFFPEAPHAQVTLGHGVAARERKSAKYGYLFIFHVDTRSRHAYDTYETIVVL
jgi:hypothetical protein